MKSANGGWGLGCKNYVEGKVGFYIVWLSDL